MLLLCFGYGYTARALAAELAGRATVIGTTRDGRDGTFAYDGGITAPLASLIGQATHILISTPPHAGENALAHAIAEQADRCRWLAYLSTTGVYGDCEGRRVTETSPVAPREARGEARLQAERLWRRQGAHIFRLAGIYGPGRSAFDAIHQGRGQLVHKPGHLFNRIHVRDIARALHASMQAPTPGALFNLADDLPAPQPELMRYAYQLLGRPAPAPVTLDQAELSPMARGFYAASRRVDASKIKRLHGIHWQYPTYREGLAAILQEQSHPTP